MIVYYCMLSISLIFNLGARIIKKKSKIMSRIFLGIGIGVPILVCGLRYGVGTDFFNYRDWFMYYSNRRSAFKTSEFGFAILIKIIYIFSKNPQLLFLTSAFIINILVMIFIKKNTEYFELGYFLFITLYFYFSSFNITRQWIAIAIVLFSINFAIEKRIIPFTICVLLATTIHNTAIFILPLYYLINTKVNIKNIIMFSIIYIIGIIASDKILEIIGIDLNRYSAYINGTNNGGGANGYAYSLIGILIITIYLLFRKSLLKKSSNSNKYFRLLILATIFSILGIKSFIFARLQLYLVPLYIIFIPNMINIIKKEQKSLIYVLILLFGIFYLNRCLMVNGGHVLPYYSIFNYNL